MVAKCSANALSTKCFGISGIWAISQSSCKIAWEGFTCLQLTASLPICPIRSNSFSRILSLDLSHFSLISVLRSSYWTRLNLLEAAAMMLYTLSWTFSPCKRQMVSLSKDKMLTWTTNVVRNAGCARFRYSLKFFLMN